MARLYNGSLSDKVVPQNFKLQPEVGSLIWLIKNREIAKGNTYISYLLAQGIDF